MSHSGAIADALALLQALDLLKRATSAGEALAKELGVTRSNLAEARSLGQSFAKEAEECQAEIARLREGIAQVTSALRRASSERDAACAELDALVTKMHQSCDTCHGSLQHVVGPPNGDGITTMTHCSRLVHRLAGEASYRAARPPDFNAPHAAPLQRAVLDVSAAVQRLAFVVNQQLPRARAASASAGPRDEAFGAKMREHEVTADAVARARENGAEAMRAACLEGVQERLRTEGYHPKDKFWSVATSAIESAAIPSEGGS